MKQLSFICALFTVLSLFSCKKERLKANGNVIAEARTVAPFSGINSSGITPIEINYGTNYSVVVKGSSNIIPYFETRVVNNVLYLGFDRANISGDDVKVVLTMPLLNKISLSGNSKMKINGHFPLQPSLDVSLSGAVDLEIGGSMALNKLKIDISGASEIDFEKLNTKHADIDISGNAMVKLQVEEKLKASISGNGKIYYRGNPVIDQRISGSGKIIKF